MSYLVQNNLNYFSSVWQQMSAFKKAASMVFISFLSVLFASSASAIAVPAAGSFAFDVYDVVVTQVLQGPIGFVGGLATIVIGAAQLTKSWVLAILGIIAGTVIIRADAIVASLGMATSVM